MASKKDLESELDRLKRESSDNQIGILYKHGETGAYYDRFKQQVDPDEYGLVVSMSYHHAPFVVDREKAEAEDWSIVESVTVEGESEYFNNLVEVSEWCINPWIDDPDDREYVIE